MAVGLLGALAACLFCAGCRLMPTPRITDDEARRSNLNDSGTPATDRPIPQPLPLPQPEIALRPTSDAEALDTPLLDEGLQRAQHEADLALRSQIRVLPDSGPMNQEAPPSQPSTQPVALESPITIIEPPQTEPADPPPAPPAPPPPATSENWEQTLARLRVLLNEKRDEQPDDSPAWDVRRRLLEWLAREPTATESNRDAAALLTGVESLLKADPGDESTTALRSLLHDLERRAPLEIADLKICKRVQGYGQFEAADSDAIRTGQPILLYCEIVGLRYEALADQPMQSRLASKIQVLADDPNVAPWELDLGTAVDHCRQPRRDYYINYRFILPGRDVLPPGSYRLQLIQEDLLSKQRAERTLAIRIE